MLAAFRQLGCVQLDPLSPVAKSHQLVLRNRTAHASLPALNRDLDQLLWQDKRLFEYWAHCASMVLTEDYPIHADRMRASLASARAKAWMAENKALQDAVVRALKRTGPLPSTAFEDSSERSWDSSGWTNGRNVNQMLHYLWWSGRAVIAGRNGTGRLWDWADHYWPDWMPREKLKPAVVEQRAAEKSLRGLGVATPQHIKNHFTRGRYPTLKSSLISLEKAARMERVNVEGVAGEWWVPAGGLATLDEGEVDPTPRAWLLSPFDNLICDRKRTQQIFNFDFTIEIYVPKDKRKFGYYVLPILYRNETGFALIGRMDAQLDRAAGVLRVHQIFAEPDAPVSKTAGRAAGQAIARAVEALAAFLGANLIEYGLSPEGWRRELR